MSRKIRALTKQQKLLGRAIMLKMLTYHRRLFKHFQKGEDTAAVSVGLKRLFCFPYVKVTTASSHPCNDETCF